MAAEAATAGSDALDTFLWLAVRQAWWKSERSLGASARNVCPMHPRRKYEPRLRRLGRSGHYESGRWNRIQTHFSFTCTQTITQRPFRLFPKIRDRTCLLMKSDNLLVRISRALCGRHARHSRTSLADPKVRNEQGGVKHFVCMSGPMMGLLGGVHAPIGGCGVMGCIDGDALRSIKKKQEGNVMIVSTNQQWFPPMPCRKEEMTSTCVLVDGSS
jgi:hypothetical protein